MPGQAIKQVTFDNLKQEISREQSRSHAQSYHIRSTRLIARDIQVHIRHLKRRIAYLEDQALKLVLHDETPKRAYQRLCTTPSKPSAATPLHSPSL